MIVTGLIFYQNINARTKEIGILKAMGTSTGNILLMILAKAFILGLIGGFAGFFAGTFIAQYFGSSIFRFTAMNIKPVWSLFYVTLVLFPFLWMIASWIPALIASRIDAAKILSEE
jgi:ABC-type antimicrobial peptide transport system permease subunit